MYMWTPDIDIMENQIAKRRMSEAQGIVYIYNIHTI